MRAGPLSDQAGQFLELLQPIEGELEAYCRRLVWDPQDLRDALHNALARAIGAFDRYHAGTNFRAWMYKILTREAFALNRKHRRLAEREYRMDLEDILLLAGETAPGPELAEGDARLESWQELLDQNLVFALRTLAEEERAVLLLRALAGLKYQEIAEALGMPVGSVVGYLGRARKKMRLALARKPLATTIARAL
jgi:RNA polymerase sigma-70 factor, ECF subfamily